MDVQCSKCKLSWHEDDMKTIYPSGKSGYCKSCNRGITVSWNKNNKEKKSMSSKQWYLNNTDRHKYLGKIWHSCNKELITKYKASWARERKYGLSDELWFAMLVDQDFKCDSCGDHIGDGARVCTDHDHRSDNDPTIKRVRHLLCNSCNTTLGMLKEDPDRIEKLKQYALKIQKEASEWNS